MNRSIAKDLEYKSFGYLFVLKETKYFKGTLCDCWCECGKFIKINKADLLNGIKKSCGTCEFSKLKRLGKGVRNINKDNAKYINKRIKTRYTILLRGRKDKNKEKYSVSLSLDEYAEFFNQKECHYCGEDIDWFGKSNAYYLDRKDDDIGYTKENCVVCCSRCNMAKGNRFTYKEWLELGKVIKSWKTN